ncbi:unnamed protein product [Moneuplotes crassus]|uniref:Tyrosine-protein kinase ephrin type A/B receptor-like domain-containing protein n=1 Tax=Euplotes crassus TaxID=5936 RepID=A0AAD1XP75_EUPCR|nr:unnamed protein product [Moneuplotes crassus]
MLWCNNKQLFHKRLIGRKWTDVYTDFFYYENLLLIYEIFQFLKLNINDSVKERCNSKRNLALSSLPIFHCYYKTSRFIPKRYFSLNNYDFFSSMFKSIGFSRMLEFSYTICPNKSKNIKLIDQLAGFKMLCLFILFILSFCCSIVNSLEIKEFENNFQGRALDSVCPQSCQTCDSSNVCTSCPDSMRLNSTSNQCEFCPDGQFYLKITDTCMSCGSSCLTLCAYKPECYECPIGEYYDLDNSQCVASCDPVTQVPINSTQTENKAYCRGFDYYVNSRSTEVVELGTKEFPYKNLKLVFIELLNYLSHRDITVNIYVRETTTNYLELNKNYIINITNVNIMPYSLINPDPKYTNLILTDSAAPTLNSWTKYSLLQTDALDISIANSSDPSASSFGLKVIFVYNSSLSIQKVNLDSEYSNIETDNRFVFPVECGAEKSINFNHIDSKISGSLLSSISAVEVNLNNINFDSYRASYCVSIFAPCNFPGGDFLGKLTSDNFTVYNSQEKIIPFARSILEMLGSGDMSINRFDCSAKVEDTIGIAILTASAQTECTPDTTEIQHCNMTNSYLTAPELQPEGGYSLVSLIPSPSYSISPARVFFHNVTFEGIDSITVRRCRSTLDVINTVGSNIILTNNYIEDSEMLDGASLSAQFAITITAKNNTFKDISGGLVAGRQVFRLGFFGPGTLIEDTQFIDCKVKSNNLLHFIPGTFPITIKNVHFKNIESVEGYALLSSDAFHGATIQNVTFEDIYKESADDTTNVMIKFGTFNLGDQNEISLIDLNIVNSTIPLFQMNSISSNEANGSSVIFQNLAYHDCVFEFSESLILLKNLFSTSDFHFKFTDSKFYNIEFTRGGKIFDFEHQISTQVVVQDTTFTNITAGSIYLESFNKNNDVTTLVLLSNITAQKCTMNDKSFLDISQGGRLEVRDSLFTNMHSSYEGPILSSKFEGTEVNILRSNFTKNTAISAGVFNIKDRSLVKCSECRIFENFAISNAVLYVKSHAHFEFVDTLMYNNYARSTPLGSILDSIKISLITGGSIYDNAKITKEEYISQTEVVCTTLCFLPDFIKNKTEESFDIVEDSDKIVLFDVIFGIISFQSMQNIHDQDKLINGFNSEISIENTTINRFITNSPIITASSSVLNISDTIFDRINMTSWNAPVILSNSESVTTFSNVTYSNSSGKFIEEANTICSMNGVHFSDIETPKELILMYSTLDCSIKNISLSNISGNYTNFIEIIKSEVSLLENIEIRDMPGEGLKITKSNIAQINQIKLNNITKGLQAINSEIVEIRSSEFNNLGGVDITSGGAVHLINSKFIGDNLTFTSNTASRGGAVYVECLTAIKQECEVSFSKSNFMQNSATEGGAIYYDSFRPSFLNTYFNNSAEYGPNIGSYPVKISQSDSSIQDIKFDFVGSGIKYPSEVRLKLVDYDEQEIATDSTSQIKISPIASNASVTGIDYAQVKNGVGTFDNLVLQAAPGKTGIEYRAFSKSIDSNLVTRVYGSVNRNLITVDFRWCQPGEMYSGNETCIECPQGTYSLEWNSTQCTTCMKNAVCQGGSKISVNPDYWRSSLNSTDLVKCPIRDICLGRFNEINEHPVECSEGYSGYLCTSCTKHGGNDFMRIGLYECEKCPNKIYNSIRIALLMILVIIFIVVLIIINIRKRNESQKSITLRILTNYLQLMGIAVSYGLDYPNALYDSFSFMERASSTSESFISFDCFFDDAQMTSFTPSTPIFKLFLSALLPLIFIIISACIWSLLGLTGHKWFDDTKRNISITIICILFLFHPTLTKQSLSLFQCTDVGNGESRMTIDMNIQCYSAEHLKWALPIGGSMMVVWVIGCPMAALVILIKFRKNLDHDIVKRYFLVLYQGLKPKVFYWEFVNTLRKILIPLTNILLSRTDIFYRIMSAVIILIIMFRVQESLKPYKFEENNKVEILAVLGGMITIFGAVISLDNTNDQEVEDVPFLRAISVSLILIVNAYFLMRWILLFLFSFETSNEIICKIRKMLGNLLCKGKTEAFTTANSELLTSKNCQKSPREKILVKKKTKRHRRKARKNQKIRRFKIESNRQFQGINDKDEGEELSAYKEILVPSSERDSTYRGTRLKRKMQHFLNKLENQPSSATPDPRTPHKISEEEKFDHKFLLNRNKPSTPISPPKPLNRIPSSSPTYFSKFRPKDKAL